MTSGTPLTAGISRARARMAAWELTPPTSVRIPTTLYYTAAGDEAHNFIVVVEDNFSNSYELEFDFNNRNVKDDAL